MSSTPRYIERKKRVGNNNSTSIVSSYNSMSHSFNDNTRRLSTVRLGSPIINEQDHSPRARSLLQNTDNGISGLRNDTISITSSTPPTPKVLIDVENPSFQSDVKEESEINNNTSHYVNEGLTNEGADITYHVKKKSHSSLHPLKKVRSASDLYNDRRGSTASAFNVPGGFRREFIVTKARERAILNDEELKQVPFLTKNFMEFLYIYGHFAGEDFEDDFFAMSSNGSEVVFDEESPLLSRGEHIKEYEPKGTTSTMKAFLIMLKSFIGTGIIFLPKGFSNGGLLFSLGMLTVFGIYSYYCYHILVLSKSSTKVTSFGDIGSKLYGNWMKNLILASLTLTQIGFSCAYIIFTSENLGAFVRNISGWDVSPQWFFILQAFIFVPLSYIRNVAKLSFPALIANGFIFCGLIIIVFFTSKELILNGAKPVNLWINESKFSLFIGTAIFAFEGIGLIIPIQDSMRHPEKFPLVLGLVIVTITILMNLIAVIGYLAYGEETQTAILLNLPQSNPLVYLIQFFYSLAILLSTPLQLFPAIAIIEKKLFGKSTGKHNNRVKWSKNILRTFFVLLCMNISWFGANDLDKFVSFVGCFACIPLVYMYPPLLHLKACVPKGNIRGKLYDIGLVFIGLASMVYTSYQIIFDSN